MKKTTFIPFLSVLVIKASQTFFFNLENIVIDKIHAFSAFWLFVGVVAICESWIARVVSSQMGFIDLKVNFSPSPPKFFKIAYTIFGVITFQDFALPCLQNDVFDLQSELLAASSAN